MNCVLHSYPLYKHSGVSWLGTVPEHWSVRRIKTLFRELDERSGDGQGELLSLTRSNGLVPHWQASNRIASVDDLSNYKVCRSGALVMNRMQAWSGMFAVASQDGLISPDYCVFGPVGSCVVKYFEHLFKTPLVVSQFARQSKGIGSGFNRLYTDDFGSIPVLVPPLPEQRAIVRYLDHADRRIQHYITAKRNSSPCWKRRSRPSSTRPSPAASTPTSASSPLASSGWVMCQSTGRYGGLSSSTVKQMNNQPLAQRS